MIQVLYVWSGDLYLDDSGTILCPLLKIQVIQVIQIWMILTGDGSHTLRGEGCLNILSWSWSTHYDCIVETLNKVGWISVCGGIPTISQRQGTGDTPLLSGIWANQRPVSWSRDHSQPIRGQYPGHVITRGPGLGLTKQNVYHCWVLPGAVIAASQSSVKF